MDEELTMAERLLLVQPKTVQGELCKDMVAFLQACGATDKEIKLSVRRLWGLTVADSSYHTNIDC